MGILVGEAFFERVERRRSDIPVDDPERAERQPRQRLTRVRVMPLTVGGVRVALCMVGTRLIAAVTSRDVRANVTQQMLW